MFISIQDTRQLGGGIRISQNFNASAKLWASVVVSLGGHPFGRLVVVECFRFYHPLKVHPILRHLHRKLMKVLELKIMKTMQVLKLTIMTMIMRWLNLSAGVGVVVGSKAYIVCFTVFKKI